MTLKILSLNAFFVSTIFISSYQETFASMKDSSIIEEHKEINIPSLSKSQKIIDELSSDNHLSPSSSSDSKESDSLILLPLEVKELKENLHEFKSPLKMEGEIFKEGILSLKEGKYTNISLQGAYSYEQSDNLRNNYFIVSTLTFYTGVQELTLRACGLTNEHLKDISSLTNLRTLNLPSNLISENGIKILTELTQLKILDLSNNYLNDICIELLSQLPYLEDVHVRGNKEITDKSLQIVLKYPHLKNINLAMSGVSIKKLTEFKRSYKGPITFAYSLK